MSSVLPVPLQRVLPVRTAVQHPDAVHRGSDADAQPEGEGGHPALHRGAGPPDGPGRLRQLQRDSPRRLARHHLDHRAQELRRPQGRRAAVWSLHLHLPSEDSFSLSFTVALRCLFRLFSRLDFFFVCLFLSNRRFPATTPPDPS